MKRYLSLTLTATVCFCFLINIVNAGGPLQVNENGEPVTWDVNQPVPFAPDQGTLGKLSNQEAVELATELFKVWEDVSTASITFKQEEQLSQDITGSNALQFFNSLTGNLSPIIFDTDGSITDAFFGVGSNESIIGFAGPDFFNLTNTGVLDTIASASAWMNGKFFDGQPNPTDLALEDFRGTFVHEFGHYIGLAHTQVNLEQLSLLDPTNLPLMFPFALDGGGENLEADDVASVSSLYPESSFTGSTGIIRGRVFLSDGITQFQGANVIARSVSNPKVEAVSSYSGVFHLDPLNSSFGGSADSQLVGFYEISGLTPGDYTVLIEQIDSSFSGGSGVGSLETPVPLPGIPEFYNEGESNSDTNECAGIISISAGQVVENIDIIINNSGTAGSLVSEQEPNNSTLEAQTVSTFSTVSGDIDVNEEGDLSLGSDDFEDLFSFTIDSTQFISTHLSFQGQSSDLDLILFDENLVLYGSSLGFNDATESSGPIELIPGTYFVGVSAFDGISNPSTSYTLDIVGSCVESDAPVSTTTTISSNTTTTEPTTSTTTSIPTQTTTTISSTTTTIPTSGSLDADFTSNPTGGQAQLTVQFTDLSDGNPIKWDWVFGDGGISKDQNPEHIYGLAGDYTVQLTVEDGSGNSDTRIKEDFIEVIVDAKSFTFNCEHDFGGGLFLGLETLAMNVGETENCTLKLTDHEPGKTVEVSSLLRNGLRSAVKIEPARSVTDENGELEVTITAIQKGRDWAAWAVQNDRGEFKFSKKTYGSGLAWGMFVCVK